MSQNSWTRCCRAKISVSGMPKVILIAGIEYFRSSEMQSSYFDDHVPAKGVKVNEFLSPGGRRKEIRVKCFEGFKKDKDLYRTRRQVDSDLATSIRFVNIQAKCEPGQVLAKFWKIICNARSIKLGKLRLSLKTGEKNNGVTMAGSIFLAVEAANVPGVLSRKRERNMAKWSLKKLARLDVSVLIQRRRL